MLADVFHLDVTVAHLGLVGRLDTVLHADVTGSHQDEVRGLGLALELDVTATHDLSGHGLDLTAVNLDVTRAHDACVQTPSERLDVDVARSHHVDGGRAHLTETGIVTTLGDQRDVAAQITAGDIAQNAREIEIGAHRRLDLDLYRTRLIPRDDHAAASRDDSRSSAGSTDRDVATNHSDATHVGVACIRLGLDEKCSSTRLDVDVVQLVFGTSHQDLAARIIGFLDDHVCVHTRDLQDVCLEALRSPGLLVRTGL